MKKRILRNILVLILLTGLYAGVNAQPSGSWRPSAETVDRLSKSQPQFNYHEEKVPSYILPEVLTTLNGKHVTNARRWTQIRRGEILELFTENVYGRVPATPYEKNFNITNLDKAAMGGRATLKQVTIRITAGTGSLDIHLTMFVPNGVPKPVPVFLLIDNRGSSNTDPTRQVKSEFWPAEEVISRGYAIAVFSNSDLDPDNYDDFKNGIHGLLDQGTRRPDSWGTLAAWAWGASRCMDYFERDNDINKDKIAVLGHSRGGKAALWAGAVDQRFALVISNESGCGGAALARRRFGETVARINESFPHWFCTNYRKWSGNEDAMPVDMHMLLSLITPRALYVDCASDDLWGDPRGSYLSLYDAVPVFKLFDKGTVIPEEMPPLNKPVTSFNVGYHIRDGSHNMLLKDWNWFMDFADKVFNPPSCKAAADAKKKYN